MTRLGSAASAEQVIVAGIVGLAAASFADTVTSAGRVLALATPPPEVVTAIAAAAISEAPATIKQARRRSACI